MRDSVESFAEIKEYRTNFISSVYRASWQSCVKEISADVVDLPLENPHWLSDKGDVITRWSDKTSCTCFSSSLLINKMVKIDIG